MQTLYSRPCLGIAVVGALLLSACGGGGTIVPASSATAAAPAAQTVSFAAPSSPTVGGGTVTLSGSSSSGLPVTYTSNTTSVCTVSGSTLTVLTDGQCTLVASQAGNASYSPATAVTVSFMINGQPQTVTFAAPTPPAIGATASLSATASSSLPVSFTASPSTVCTVSGSTLTAVAAGACTVTASQGGNTQYAAAMSVSNTITIAGAPATPTPVVFSSGFTATNFGGLTAATLNGGTYGGYAGSNLDGFFCPPGTNNATELCAGQGFAGTSGATSSAFYFFQSPTIPTGEYVGLYLQAPGVTAISAAANTPGLQLTNQTSLSFMFNQNPEWYGLPNHNVVVILTLGNFYNTGTVAAPAPCNIKLETVFTPTSAAATAYTLPLSQFVVAQNCGIGTLTPSSVTAALAANAGGPVAQIDFQADGGASAITTGSPALPSSANFTTATSGGVYPSTLSLTGPVTFQ